MLFANARAGQLATIVNSQNNPSSLTHRIGPRPATAQTARAGFPASAQAQVCALKKIELFNVFWNILIAYAVTVNVAQTQSDSREVDPGIAGVDRCEQLLLLLFLLLLLLQCDCMKPQPTFGCFVHLIFIPRAVLAMQRARNLSGKLLNVVCLTFSRGNIFQG